MASGPEPDYSPTVCILCHREAKRWEKIVKMKRVSVKRVPFAATPPIHPASHIFQIIMAKTCFFVPLTALAASLQSAQREERPRFRHLEMKESLREKRIPRGLPRAHYRWCCQRGDAVALPFRLPRGFKQRGGFNLIVKFFMIFVVDKYYPMLLELTVLQGR